MKVESGIEPQKYKIKHVKNGIAKVYLRKNITTKTIEVEGNTDEIFEYDEVLISIADRNNLEKYIENNFEMLFEEGIAKENEPAQPKLEERLEALEEMELERLML